MKAKALRRILLCLAVSLVLVSCYPIGTEGQAFICYSWVALSAVGTDDPAFGPTIYNGVYEDAVVGTWNFQYISFDDSNWEGSYTVYRNPGVFLADGEDVYFELTLYSTGPSFYAWTEDFAYRGLAADTVRADAERDAAHPQSTVDAYRTNEGAGRMPASSIGYDTKSWSAGPWTISLSFRRIER